MSLRAVASVDGEGGGAGGLGLLQQGEDGDVGGRVADARLHAYGQARGGLRGGDDAPDEFRMAHERRAGALADDLRGRAPGVDVDARKAPGGGDLLSGGGEFIGIRAVEMSEGLRLAGQGLQQGP